MSFATNPASNEGQLQPEEPCQLPEMESGAVKETDPGIVNLEAEFQSAATAAIEKGKIFSVAEGDYHVKLADLLPELSRVRKNINQRLEGYKKGRRNGAPNWGKWLVTFRAETGVRLCDKTIKKELDIFDDVKPTPRPKKPRATTITSAEGRKMGLALLAMHEALSNVDEHGNVLLKPEDIAPILRMAPSSAKLNRIVEGLPDETEVQVDNSGIASGAAPDPNETAGASLPNPSLKESPLKPLKPGDVPALGDRLIEENLQGFETAFAVLPPDAFADGLRSFDAKIAERFRKPDGGRLSIKIQYIPAKPKGLSSRVSRKRPQNQSLFEIPTPESQIA